MGRDYEPVKGQWYENLEEDDKSVAIIAIREHILHWIKCSEQWSPSQKKAQLLDREIRKRDR